jgi:hypothetical protein
MNMNSNIYEVNVTATQASTEVKFCGATGTSYGAFISNVYLYFSNCTKCITSY